LYILGQPGVLPEKRTSHKNFIFQDSPMILTCLYKVKRESGSSSATWQEIKKLWFERVHQKNYSEAKSLI